MSGALCALVSRTDNTARLCESHKLRHFMKAFRQNCMVEPSGWFLISRKSLYDKGTR